MRGSVLTPTAQPSMQGAARPSHEIRSLTGIRGVAALYVVFYHYFQSTPGFRPFAYTFRGYLSVDLFFVLSGFVLTLTYRDRLRPGPFAPRAYAAFVYTRLARIYPVYFVILLAILALVAAGVFDPVRMGNVVANLALVQAWGGPTSSINGPGWSISVELAAYLVFPFVAALVLDSSRRVLVAVTVVAVGALCFVATRTDADLSFALRHGPLDVYSSGALPFPLIRCFGGFALGVVACRLAASANSQRIFGIRGMADVLVLLVVGAWRFPMLDVLTVLLFVPLVIALSQERSFASRLLGWGAVYWLGLVSYSVYLLHAPFGGVFRQPLEHLLNSLNVPKASGLSGVLLLPPLVALAAACFYGVERPARDSARRLLRQRHAG